MICGAQQLHERALVASLEAFRKCVATTMGSPEQQCWLRRGLLWPSRAQCRQPPCGTRVEGKAWHSNAVHSFVSLLCANVASPLIIQQPQSHSENSMHRPGTRTAQWADCVSTESHEEVSLLAVIEP